jgi:hypothetical protein
MAVKKMIFNFFFFKLNLGKKKKKKKLYSYTICCWPARGDHIKNDTYLCIMLLG